MRKILWYGKLSELIRNRSWINTDTSRLHMPKIAVKFSKILGSERIWQRGSLTTPIVAKGLKATQTLDVLIFFKKMFFLMSGLKFTLSNIIYVLYMYFIYFISRETFSGERIPDFVISCYLVLLYSIVTWIFF